MKLDVLMNDDPPEDVDDLEFDAFVSFRYRTVNLSCLSCDAEQTNCILFLCFSHFDSKFVINEIQPFLEEMGFRLCIHERDFLVGASIPANIEAAINHSRRMIMIISK